MANTRNINVEHGIVSKTKCDRNHACLSDEQMCYVEPFVDRDVPVLICRNERACAYKKKYLQWFICSCPVNLASYSLN